jgi:hypothetical protein
MGLFGRCDQLIILRIEMQTSSSALREVKSVLCCLVLSVCLQCKLLMQFTQSWSRWQWSIRKVTRAGATHVQDLHELLLWPSYVRRYYIAFHVSVVGTERKSSYVDVSADILWICSWRSPLSYACNDDD